MISSSSTAEIESATAAHLQVRRVHVSCHMLITHPRQRIITFRATAYVGARKHTGAHDEIRPPAAPGVISTGGPAALVGGLTGASGGYSEAVVSGTPYCAGY